MYVGVLADVPPPPVGRPNGYAPDPGERRVPGIPEQSWWAQQTTGTKVAMVAGGAVLLIATAVLVS